MSWVAVRSTENRYELYMQMEEWYGRGHERICINRRWTASSKCQGCCMFEEHTGFLTSELIKRHRCVENDCIHFLPKPRRRGGQAKQ